MYLFRKAFVTESSLCNFVLIISRLMKKSVVFIGAVALMMGMMQHDAVGQEFYFFKCFLLDSHKAVIN